MAMVKVITTILSDDTTNNVPVELAITGHSLGGLIAVINDGKRGLWLACLHCFSHKSRSGVGAVSPLGVPQR